MFRFKASRGGVLPRLRYWDLDAINALRDMLSDPEVWESCEEEIDLDDPSTWFASPDAARVNELTGGAFFSELVNIIIVILGGDGVKLMDSCKRTSAVLSLQLLLGGLKGRRISFKSKSNRIFCVIQGPHEPDHYNKILRRTVDKLNALAPHGPGAA